MGPSKIRKALDAVKDKTSIGLAKVNNSNSLSDLEVAIVKATRHDENPSEEKYIREILSLTSYSRMYINSCVNILSKRLSKTKNWIVALKTLILIHRLLSEGDAAYEQEIFFATCRGTRLLNMSDFRDTSHSDSWDFSAFVRTYALYLDERLEFRMHGRREQKNNGLTEEGEEMKESPSSIIKVVAVNDMKLEQIFVRTQHLLQLLERFLACKPTGAAKHNRIVTVALYPLVKESIRTYYDITEIMGVLIDRFMELEVSVCVKVYEIFTRISKQFEELDQFYNWCKAVGLARSSEYPEVEKIGPKKLEIMDEFIRDRSALSKRRCIKNIIPKRVVVVEETTENKEDNKENSMGNMKALPAPETSDEEVKEQKEIIIEEQIKEEVDFLNLREDPKTTEEEGNKLALALFAREPAATSLWEAFSNAKDWETTLVVSSSTLTAPPRTSLAGGFDMLLLDGMYQHGAMMSNGGGAKMGSGSASSVALEANTAPYLALPAPPGSNGTVEGDPFAASLTVPPPTYVQMSDMEKKQQKLVEEQLMWQQYARDGMQGAVAFNQLQMNPYAMGGYLRR